MRTTRLAEYWPVALFVFLLPSHFWGQCSPNNTYWVATTVAQRISVDDIYLGTEVTVEDGDAPYATTTLKQNDTVMLLTTTTPIGSTLTASASNGNPVETK